MQPAHLTLVADPVPVSLSALPPETIPDLATEIALARRRLTQALGQLIKAEDLARAGDDCGAQGRILVALARLESEQERLSTLVPSACEDFLVRCGQCGARHMFSQRACCPECGGGR